MTTHEMIPTIGILLVYCVAHGLVVAGLFRTRRHLPAELRERLSPWMLLLTAAPIVGSLISIWVFSRVARAYQDAAEATARSRSDRGFAAGVGYGVASTLASWTSNGGVGFLALCCLLTFFVQVELAIRILRGAKVAGSTTSSKALASC